MFCGQIRLRYGAMLESIMRLVHRTENGCVEDVEEYHGAPGPSLQCWLT